MKRYPLFLTLILLISLLPAKALSQETQPSAPLQNSEVIAYTTGSEIHLINPDGTEDRTIWQLPGSLDSGISSLEWRPDAGEIAFASDHESAYSWYGRDLYAIRPDGSGYRRVTNPPARGAMSGYPQGSVEVTVRNDLTGGPLVVYVMGASEPQSVTVGSGASQTLTFPSVADFGDVAQPVVAIFGQSRWFNAGVAPDVQPGQTVDAGTLVVSGDGLRLSAEKPTWRSDGSRIGYRFGDCAGFKSIASSAPAGTLDTFLMDPGVAGFTCTIDWSPLPGSAGDLLYDEWGAFEGHIYRTSEGSSQPGELLVTYGTPGQVFDLQWLPDGSGFIFQLTSEFSDSANLYEYTFATQQVKQITHFSDELAGLFSISPDGQYIVFERTPSLEATPDLWIMRRDGSELRLLVEGAGRPAWSPAAPQLPIYVYLPAVMR